MASLTLGTCDFARRLRKRLPDMEVYRLRIPSLRVGDVLSVRSGTPLGEEEADGRRGTMSLFVVDEVASSGIVVSRHPDSEAKQKRRFVDNKHLKRGNWVLLRPRPKKKAAAPKPATNGTDPVALLAQQVRMLHESQTRILARLAETEDRLNRHVDSLGGLK